MSKLLLVIAVILTASVVVSLRKRKVKFEVGIEMEPGDGRGA